MLVGWPKNHVRGCILKELLVLITTFSFIVTGLFCMCSKLSKLVPRQNYSISTIKWKPFFQNVWCVYYDKFQPVSTRGLSLVETKVFVEQPLASPGLLKTYQQKLKILTSPTVGPIRTTWFIAFRFGLTLGDKIAWFGRQMAVSVNKRQYKAILRCSQFQKITWGCYLCFFCFFLCTFKIILLWHWQIFILFNFFKSKGRL